MSRSNSGREAYTASGWAVGVSPEMNPVAGADVSPVPRKATCEAAQVGEELRIPSGSWANGTTQTGTPGTREALSLPEKSSRVDDRLSKSEVGTVRGCAVPIAKKRQPDRVSASEGDRSESNRAPRPLSSEELT